MPAIANTLKTYFGHNALAIEIIIAIMLGIILVWFFSNLGKESKDDSSQNLKDIETALKRVLQSTPTSMPSVSQATNLIKDDDDDIAMPNVKPMAVVSTPAPSIVTVVSPANTEELAKLKAEMELKAKKLSDLEASLKLANDELTKAKAAQAAQAEAPAGAAPGAGVDMEALNKKLSDLEARLGEYEIIEDDIANLSLYKEENVRLKSELEKVKQGGGAPQGPPHIVPAPTTVNMETPGPDAPAKKVVAAAAAAVVASVAPTPAPEPAASPVPAQAQVDADKLLEEFNTMTAAAEKAPAPADGKDTGEKLIAEFENFMKGSGG
ncbi:MAG: hypothetical protein SGI74_13275 [Oligoflexia bacterium]|nr:hypothetical protein [Oligoflexia bacterium]